MIAGARRAEISLPAKAGRTPAPLGRGVGTPTRNDNFPARPDEDGAGPQVGSQMDDFAARVKKVSADQSRTSAAEAARAGAHAHNSRSLRSREIAEIRAVCRQSVGVLADHGVKPHVWRKVLRWRGRAHQVWLVGGLYLDATGAFYVGSPLSACPEDFGAAADETRQWLLTHGNKYIGNGKSLNVGSGRALLTWHQFSGDGEGPVLSKPIDAALVEWTAEFIGAQ